MSFRILLRKPFRLFVRTDIRPFHMAPVQYIPSNLVTFVYTFDVLLPIGLRLIGFGTTTFRSESDNINHCARKPHTLL